MTDQKESAVNVIVAPATTAEVKAMFEEQKTHIDKRFDMQQAFLLEHSRNMGANIVQGFERVGDKIVSEMKETRNSLVPSATNKRKLDIKVIMPIIYTLCGVIGSLIVWFTGVKPFIPSSIDTQKVIVNEQRTDAPNESK